MVGAAGHTGLSSHERRHDCVTACCNSSSKTLCMDSSASSSLQGCTKRKRGVAQAGR